jgi:Protein of unknown function (DUF2855)
MKGPEADSGSEFLVRRADLKQHAVVPLKAPNADTLGSGQLLLAIDRFAFTSNNVTYAVFGDAMSYWAFFPAADGWGKVPVWGFADIVASRHPGLSAGERLYGYLPMATHLVITADRVQASRLVDVAAHRVALPAVYNQYSRVGGDSGYDARFESEQMLLRPLFGTSFLLDDFLADNAFFGARSVLLSSASSKTASGLAYLLQSKRRANCQVIGLTSPANRAFVERVGYYDRVVAYDEIAALPADVATVFVDMAGSDTVLRAVHGRFGERLMHSCRVGGTHWDDLAANRISAQPLPGPKPKFFFAPDQIKKRVSEWGSTGFESRLAEVWREFLGSVEGWLEVRYGFGPAAVGAVYDEMLNGRTDPAVGHVLSLTPR